RAGKEMLSRATATLIHMPLLDDDAPLGREQFERLAQPILQRTVAATRAAIAEAEIDPEAVAGLFLVGGSSRIPLAATLLHRALPSAPSSGRSPDIPPAVPAWSVTMARCWPWCSARTAVPSPAPVPTARYGCGTWFSTTRSATRSPATRTGSNRWRSARTGVP